ncbi:MAG TPA: 3-oxoacyl-[acyl-carrier-protein] synthase III C-terminal domain-containing protein [Gemmatimonadaceae bacterium]|nr:3-oxoacyl-[acyl-carrier-protein] synthase III C-terminal domain-containing protein [Gemmatimonadaceae bacterium]
MSARTTPAAAASGPCVRGIAYAFPEGTRTVRELAAAGALESDAAVLEGFGFDRVHVAGAESPYDLALAAASRLLREHDVDPESVGLLVYGGTPAAMAFAPNDLAADAARDGAAGMLTLDRFRYPATRLQFDLGLTAASAIGVDQLACTTLLAAVRVARALCLAEGIERALCVASEFFPARAGREAVFNCTSDAACAVLVERAGERNRVVGASTVTKGFYWDPAAMRDEVVASYFPTARHAIARTVAAAGWRAADVDWVMPHNVSARSWEILMRLAGLPNARLWTGNIARRGHTLAGDNFINLSDALDAGAVTPGQKVLLFSYGFGAHWTGLALEA